MKGLEIFFKKILLSIYLAFHRRPANNGDLIVSPSSRILLVRLNKIGDALVTTFLIKLIKTQLNCEIDVVADKKNHFIFEEIPFVRKVYTFPKNPGGVRKLKREINSRNYKAVFDLHDDVSATVTMFIGSLKKIKNKVGFHRKNYKVFNYLIPYPDPRTNHVMERYLAFADFLRLDYRKNDIRVFFPLNVRTKIDVRYDVESKFRHREMLVGINISAGSDARFWGTERYENLIAYFKKYDVNLLIIASESDRLKAERLVGGKVRLFVDPDFNRFAACVATLDFLFTPDTSIVHLASAYDIPTFGIYVKYNTENLIWYPYNTPNETVVIEEPTFRNLEFDTVRKKLVPFFERIYAKRNP